MIRSMTAFANINVEINNLNIGCEIRSVNHRYCDIAFKIPEKFRFLEPEIRTVISEKIKRGKIDFSLNYKIQPNLQKTLNINNDMLTALLNATGEIEQEMKNPGSFTALEILSFPGIQQEPEYNNDLIAKDVKAMVEKLLIDMIEIREREGVQLAALIRERCEKMQLLVKAAHERMPDVLSNIREKLKLKINELISEPDFDRLEQELVILTQKLDVEEELDRLETHINEVSRILEIDEPVGRRLDFLMQEMNREANTLGSKSADKEMTGIAIDMKVLIEQMREQVQNIE